MDEVGERYAEVMVSPDQADAARALKPLNERAGVRQVASSCSTASTRARLAALGERAHPERRRPVRRAGRRRDEEVAMIRPLLLGAPARAVGEPLALARAVRHRRRAGIRRRDVRVQDRRADARDQRARRAAPAQGDHRRRTTWSPLLMMAVGLIVAVIYCGDALYGERRDRSILLWKSLPVSDAMTVLAKLTIPVLVLPVIVWALTIAVQRGAAAVEHRGAGGARRERGAALDAAAPRQRDALGLLYHLVALHGISTAPLYAWLLLVSAWAPRAPFAWAILPPAAIMVFERVAFGTTRIAHLLLNQLGGGASAPPPAPGDDADGLDERRAVGSLLAAPGLWIGFAVAAVFVAGAVRLRRSAQPA